MSQSVPKMQISREEIRAVYAQGEDAVIALVEQLLKKIAQLEARIETVENQSKKDSRNSSKPPWDLRQVHDLPPLQLVVREHQAQEKCCPHCGVLNQGAFPAEVGQFDETGMRVQGKLMWLHVACTEGLTYYFIHAKRGRAAMEAMEIWPNFTGISVHDGWASYAGYDCAHALCNAHHLRELLFVVERYDQAWADEMMTLLIAIKDQVEAAQAARQSVLTPRQLADFERLDQHLIEQGLKANPPPPIATAESQKKGRPKQSPPKNLLDRLQANQAAVLSFMYECPGAV